MDRLVLCLAAVSAACFLAFALWPRSSPSGQLEVVRGSEDDPPTWKGGHPSARAGRHRRCRRHARDDGQRTSGEAD